MSKALEEFLALRNLAGGQHLKQMRSAEILAHRCSAARLAAAFQEGVNDFDGGDAETSEVGLAALFEDLLAAHPSAPPVRDRFALANYLAHGVIHRFHNTERIAWERGRRLRTHDSNESLWVAQCPAGHLTAEPIENRQLIGWACEQCQRVYDSRECGLVRRF